MAGTITKRAQEAVIVEEPARVGMDVEIGEGT